MNKLTGFRFSGPRLACDVAVTFLIVLTGFTYQTHAALSEAGQGADLITGLDDDRQDNALLQSNAGVNQSLNRTDVLEGGKGNDVMFGFNGNDVIDGGPDNDIILGGPDPGAPNSDIMFGGPGDDVNLWAPGDGSEVFIGGPGKDALIFGRTDLENTGFPKLTFGVPGFPQGIPTANVSVLTNFCTIENSPLPGYDFLVRFKNAAGAIIVTLRVKDVEQVFCSQSTGNAITFADLTVPSPSFTLVSQNDVNQLNALVGTMIR
jgi:hypothetical protein